MKRFLLIFTILIFVGFWVIPNSVFAETSPDGCVSWNFQCVSSSSVTASLSWTSFTPADVPELPHPNCTFSTVSYTVQVVNVGTASAGSSTHYSWTNLTPKTIYQWKVAVAYHGVSGYCPNLSGSASTDTYSFTTPSCEDGGNNPPVADAGPDKEVDEGQQVVLEGSGAEGESCSKYFCGEPDGQGGCKPRVAGEYGLPVCKRCDGVSLVPVNFANNSQDAEGSNLCNQTCKKCSSGNCVNQTSSQDLFNQCEITEGCDTGNCSGQGPWCGYYTSGQRDCPLCQTCVGATSGACVDASECQNCYGCAGWCYRGSCYSSCYWYMYGYLGSVQPAGSPIDCRPSTSGRPGYGCHSACTGCPSSYFYSSASSGTCTMTYNECICK